MPVFEFSFHAQAQQQQGAAPAPPAAPFAQGLLQCGPLLPVQIGIATKVAATLQKFGLAAPPPSSGLALIDTGATISGVDKRVVSALGLQPISVQKVFTARGSSEHPVYAARYAFPNTNLPGMEFGRLLEIDLADQKVPMMGNQPLIAIIGREILSRFILIYNGPGGHYTLAF
jgi:hypothetical protein